MRALVTGHRGFIGRHITRVLEDAGYRVSGADIADGDDARDCFRYDSTRFDVAVHCAAVVGGRAVIEGAPLDLAVNLELDAAFFAWAERTRPGRAVYLSSSAAYPVRLQTLEWLDHHGPTRLAEHYINLTQWGKTGDWSPDALYGWCKLTGEHLALLARDAGVTVSIVRPFSGYGADQADCYPFPALAGRAARREDPFVIWGSGDQVRDFIHVDDICAAIMTMISEGIDGPVNLGTGRAASMRDLAGLMCAAAAYEPEFRPLPGKPSGVAYRVADITRMSEFFTPKVSLEEGVARALASAR